MKFFIIILLFVSSSFASLIRPAFGDVLSFIHIVFEWEQLPNVSGYNLKVGTDQLTLDTNPVLDIVVDDNMHIETENLSWSNTYYWKVCPIYISSETENCSESSTFYISQQKFPSIDANIYNEDNLQEGLVIFGGFAPDVASAVIDKYGNEIWNDGYLNFILNHVNEYGNIYGLSTVDFPIHTGSKINYDNNFIWSAPADANLDGVINEQDAIDIHEIKQLPNGNYMAFVPDFTQLGPIPQGDWTFLFQIIGYQADGITNEYPYIGMRIVEWDEEGNEIWNWNPFDHFSMLDTDLYGGNWWGAYQNGNYDWMHSNAFHFDENESVIYVSHRHLSRISKIAYPSGDVIWNMGMPAQYNTGENNICTDLGFSFQHNIQLLDDGSLLFFDNGNLSQMLMGDTNPTTRIRRIRVINDSFCETIWQYDLPANLFGLGMGSVQLLDNGNYFIYTFGSGLNIQQPTLREVTPNYDVVWNYEGSYEPPYNNVAWYRSYKIPSLHPDAFSVIINNFTQIDGIDIAELSTINTLDFTISNKSGYTQNYKYSFGETTDGPPMFEFEEGEITLGPYEDTVLSFSSIDLGIISSNIYLSIWPEHHDYAIKELSFNIAQNNSIFGDITLDGLVNVLDIVTLVNIILEEDNFNNLGDLNQDGQINVIDVVLLVNLILE